MDVSPGSATTQNHTAAMLLPLLFGSLLGEVAFAQNASLPDSAQVIDQKSLAVLETVDPPSVQNLSSVFLPPGITSQDASSKPFHVYDEAFLELLGSNVSLTLIASSAKDPLFHEAVVWYPPTDEVFFVQNAGAKDAGTGLNKSSIIQKISLAQAEAVAQGLNSSVDVIVVNSTPTVINPNGATNYQGQIVYTGEGQGDDIAPALFLMNPLEPYNTTQLVNNYYGRQLNSLNDVAINPLFPNAIYFTDSLYGALQDFRPWPTTTIPPMVYRFDPSTGAIRVVAADLNKPNGLTFSPDGSVAYVTDTGALEGFYGVNASLPATIYSYNVTAAGNFANRQTFAYVSPWRACIEPDGVLLGKIWVGSTVANFRFTGKGRMVIAAETKLYYVNGWGVEGGDPQDQY
ncbi:uncharacterized protein AB675_5386 [Cyphellophora attinorum]|uniref:SMP-30/Gluconolactonase/LRE-like region domain-containing protein n=1 Tax=Cyphellophora attinorum TaxID=1664694 RepID=A0A0N0NNW5_9EURO|nr:uncharacterized protein AB675_5386 [Phialophora attinorum]KPI42061.1 hypothetical protein AB675_5386 [Phialophora attinorum]